MVTMRNTEVCAQSVWCASVEPSHLRAQEAQAGDCVQVDIEYRANLDRWREKLSLHAAWHRTESGAGSGGHRDFTTLLPLGCASRV